MSDPNREEEAEAAWEKLYGGTQVWSGGNDNPHKLRADVVPNFRYGFLAGYNAGRASLTERITRLEAVADAARDLCEGVRHSYIRSGMSPVRIEQDGIHEDLWAALSALEKSQ